jgi:hypothetical protein
MEAAKKNNIFKLFLFFFILFLIFYRSPYIFIHGRFIAEEGSVYFANAFKNNFINTIFFIDYLSGYLNFWANLSSFFASVPPIEYAPLVTVYLSLIPKLLIFFFILHKELFFFESYLEKLLACCVVLFSSAMVPEIWANTINSQVYFAILTLVIFLIKNQKHNFSLSQLFLISIAGLTGLYSCIIFPIFFLKFIKFKIKQDFYNFLILFIAALIQFIVIFYSKSRGILYENKLNFFISYQEVVSFYYNIFIKTFLGRELTVYLINFFNLPIPVYLILISSLFVPFFYFLFKKNFFLEENNFKFFIFAFIFQFITVSFLVLVGNTSNQTAGRYAVLPSVILLFISIILFRCLKNRLFKYFVLFFLFISLSVGFLDYKYKAKYFKLLECVNCPLWASEVKKWEKDSNYNLNIWPYPRKSMKLNKS